jgi:alanine racemase
MEQIKPETHNKGWIEVICGSMFSGKTEELIRRLKRAIIARQEVRIFKPKLDRRYDELKVVSHDSNYIASVPVHSSAEILTGSEGAEVVGIDEAQFFDDGLPAVCKTLADRGVRVIVAGLDMDFLGNPFGPLPHLMAVSEYVKKSSCRLHPLRQPGASFLQDSGRNIAYYARGKRQLRSSLPQLLQPGARRRQSSIVKYTVQHIAEVTGGQLFLQAPERTAVEDLLTDSRKIVHPETSLFFALQGDRHDGHKYISSLIESGVTNFVVSRRDSIAPELQANFVLVSDTLAALQTLAASHRRRFQPAILGITGSNGKTIVKEWLYQLLRPDRNIVRSPKSYNSQVGVPLSIWQLEEEHELALIEAGISRPGEMQRLAEIIRPTLGLFTNIGQAHDENFLSLDQKVEEKMLLFSTVNTFIYCRDYLPIHIQVVGGDFLPEGARVFTWSRKVKADLQVGRISRENDQCNIQGIYNNAFATITIPFTDDASVENAIHCWAVMLVLGYSQEVISERMHYLSPVAMRLELKEGINNCSVINDSYNSDIGSLTIALDFLNQQKQHDKRTLVLSDILQTGRNEAELYAEVSALLEAKKVDSLIGIGDAIGRQQAVFNLPKKFYPTTDEFLKDFSPARFRDETILLKGARPFGFEKISHALQQKAHETMLEVNLNALVHNLNYYRSRLKPGTKTMVMVKAFSYGSGSFEIANTLQFHHVDYLAVAYSDEGVELRNRGITLPILVMNPEVQSFETMIKYRLEPEIYNFRLLNQLHDVLKRYPEPAFSFPVHIKLDTGMHRLGFEETEMAELVVRLKNIRQLRMQSVFSHLSASDEAEHDGFTKQQIARFNRMSDLLCKAFDYPVMRHILNSAGIIRFSEAQYDMVRLGIGLYGFAPTHHEQHHLQNVATLKTTISQVKNVSAGESIGYSLKGRLKRDSQIATVAIGYADGLSRRMGNGNGKMLVGAGRDGAAGKQVPIVGNVCMDMCMLDVTNVPVKEGEEVIVFGPGMPLTEMSQSLGTIPYEVLVNVSQRVKRVYFHE